MLWVLLLKAILTRTLKIFISRTASAVGSASDLSQKFQIQYPVQPHTLVSPSTDSGIIFWRDILAFFLHEIAYKFPE